MKPSDLESLIQRKLAELPAPKAPGTLLPRIMAEVRLAEQATSNLEPWLAETWWPWAVA